MKKLIIVLVSILSFMFIGCTSEEVLIDTSYDKLALKIENKDSFILYVGSSECSHCATFKPILEDVIKENHLKVYYINMANLSKAKYKAVMDKVDGKGTPMLVYLENGKTKISPKIEGAQTKEAVIDFFEELDIIKGE